MRGHLRQRGPNTWELRAYLGRDLLTGRHRYRTRTLKGGKREVLQADADRNQVRRVGVVIHAHTVDLSASPAGLLAEIGEYGTDSRCSFGDRAMTADGATWRTPTVPADSRRLAW